MNAFFWLLLVIVLVALFGGAIFAVGWWLLWTVLIGLVIGALARLLVKGTSGFGAGATILCGIAGSVIGGWIAYWLDLGGFVQFLIAVLVAAVFVGIGSAGAANED